MSDPQSLPRSAPPLSAGRVLGDKFEITGVLGEGGTGIVYDARRIAENDAVALKVIHPHLLGDAQVRGRFTREAAILRRLTGKHLCPIIDFGELEDPRGREATLLYIALPKIDGPALDRVIVQEGPLPIDRVTAIITQVCQALSSAHAQGVIHRDLKPANVILRSLRRRADSDAAPSSSASRQLAAPRTSVPPRPSAAPPSLSAPEEHAVVVDFGMAKIVTGGSGTGTTSLTAHNMLFGTPEYMAPEQARGDELDARCDVYAVGVMLYQLVTGVVPFGGATALGVLTAHLTSEPIAPRTRAPERPISRALEAVILHALAKDPANRYPTAAALATAIAQARVAPDDEGAVLPHAVIAVDRDDVDGHAATIPSPLPSGPPPDVAPRSRGSRDSVTSVRIRRPDAGIGPRGWALVWVVAGAIGIAVGIYLSLRAS